MRRIKIDFIFGKLYSKSQAVTYTSRENVKRYLHLMAFEFHNAHLIFQVKPLEILNHHVSIYKGLVSSFRDCSFTRLPSLFLLIDISLNSTMAKSAKFSLKLLIDEEKNKVVLAEAGQGFVDVLFSLLTLPMGTIAKLLEKHQKLPQVLGCYEKLNKSVTNLGIENFETEACKSMLMYPKSTKEVHCRRLKLNMDDTESTKFYICSNFYKKDNSCRYYSNFYTSRCSCGNSIGKAVHVPEEVQAGYQIGNAVDGVFVSCRSSFIVTDDLKVTLNSIGAIVDVLKDLRYQGFSDMREMVIEVGFE